MKRFEVDARVFQEKISLEWDLRRIGSCSLPDDELLKCAHDSTAFALVLESWVYVPVLAGCAESQSLYNTVSKVSKACTLLLSSHSHESKTRRLPTRWIIFWQIAVSKRNVLVQCEILTRNVC